MLQKMFVRAFAQASATAAAELAERLRQHLAAAAAQVQVRSTQPYWKIEGYQEICLDVQFFENGTRGFAAIIDRLGTGWMQQRPGEAIWNAGGSATFAEPAVRWAQAELQEL